MLLLKSYHFFLALLVTFSTSAQSHVIKYDSTYKKISLLLKNNGAFKKAAILTETVFYETDIEKDSSSLIIDAYSKIAEFTTTKLNIVDYKSKDSSNYKLNLSIHSTITKNKKALWLKADNINTQPFNYNFDDPQGDQDWTNTFVTKLLATHQGNCRSLTYLYKILADKLGAKCWLALAPNHIYIRNYSDQIGWYNTELTNGTFPTDAWIAATGYVSTDAIRSGIYLDTLSNQQAIGLCVLDLAQGYLKKTNNYTDGFVLKCCNLVLQYHAVNPIALLLKAEALKRTYLKQKSENDTNASTTYNEMEQTYLTLVKLGYREMPYKEYQKWLKTSKESKEKYQNKKIKANSY